MVTSLFQSGLDPTRVYFVHVTGKPHRNEGLSRIATHPFQFVQSLPASQQDSVALLGRMLFQVAQFPRIV
jgi:hypothetical protein